MRARGSSTTSNVHQKGMLLVAAAIVLGLALAGWLVGLYGTRPAFLIEVSPKADVTGSARAELGQGLVLRSDNRGQVLFGKYCDSCHPGGDTGRGSSLLIPEFRRDFQTEAQVTQLVRQGTCKMPAFDQFRLSNEDLGQIVTFVLARSRTAAQASGAAPLPPLNGPGILEQKCNKCHGIVAPVLNPREPRVLSALDGLSMARCAGLTSGQRETLQTFLREQQRQ